MLLCKGSAHNGNARHQCARCSFGLLDFVPFFGQIKCGAQRFFFRLGRRYKRLRQHGDSIGIFCKRRHALGVFALPLDRYVLSRYEAVLFEDIVQGILRGCAFAARINGSAFQVCNRLYGIAVLNDIKDTERIDCEYLYTAVHLVVEYACKVRRNCSDIHLTLYQFCADLIRGSDEFERVGR